VWTFLPNYNTLYDQFTIIPSGLQPGLFSSGYIDKGVANSAVIKDLSNQIRSNQVDSLISRAAFLPQVDFNGYLMYAPTVNGWGYSEVITNGQNLTGTLKRKPGHF